MEFYYRQTSFRYAYCQPMSMKEQVRIGCGSGFWGDSLSAPLRLLQTGELDYLVLDYLAEVSMSILAGQRAKNPAWGYVQDFSSIARELLPELSKRRVKLLTNAGGMNPLACGLALKALAQELGLAGTDAKAGLKIAVVLGDNLLGDNLLGDNSEQQIKALQAAGEEFRNLDTAREFKEISANLRSANAYIGAEQLVAALNDGADIVICGRAADPSLTLAPLMHEFKWSADEWDKLAAGTIAGHIIECGAQASGGNYACDWRAVKDAANIGYPIVEVSPSGNFIVCKPEGSGGLVTLASVKEQLVYEIGDPRNFITPDVTADFCSVKLEQVAENRVRLSSAKGQAATPFYKVSMSYFAGYAASSQLVYSYPDAHEKARAAAGIVQEKLKQDGLNYDDMVIEVLGVDACHGAQGKRLLGSALSQLPEVSLRIAVRSREREKVQAFTRYLAPLVLSGPPFATSYFGAKGEVREVFAYWPTLVRKDLLKLEHRLL